MSEHKVASRYAKALIDLLQEQNNLDQGYKDIKEFLDVLSKTPPLASLLKSPIIHGHKKVAVMNAIFEKSFQKITMGFFTLIIQKKREYYLHAVAQAFVEQYMLIKNMGIAEVKSAVSLDAKTNEEIRRFIEQFTGKKIEIISKTDAALIGGIVIKTEDKLYDASIKGSLEKAKKELLNNTYISN